MPADADPATGREHGLVRKGEVSAVELRRHLSALLDAAWQEPLLVTRYHVPWVWVLSDATWQQHRQQAFDAIAGHPLACIRRQVDAALAREHALGQRLVRNNRLHAAPETILRALLLALIYDFASVADLHDQISHNRLFDWFVGREPPLTRSWRVDGLAADLRELLQDAGVVELVDRLLPELVLEELAAYSGIRIERARLREWKARYGL
jgi:hypothetical protein